MVIEQTYLVYRGLVRITHHACLIMPELGSLNLNLKQGPMHGIHQAVSVAMRQAMVIIGLALASWLQ